MNAGAPVETIIILKFFFSFFELIATPSLWFVRIGDFQKEKVINNIITIKGRLKGATLNKKS